VRAARITSNARVKASNCPEIFDSNSIKRRDSMILTAPRLILIWHGLCAPLSVFRIAKGCAVPPRNNCWANDQLHAMTFSYAMCIPTAMPHGSPWFMTADFTTQSWSMVLTCLMVAFTPLLSSALFDLAGHASPRP